MITVTMTIPATYERELFEICETQSIAVLGSAPVDGAGMPPKMAAEVKLLRVTLSVSDAGSMAALGRYYFGETE